MGPVLRFDGHFQVAGMMGCPPAALDLASTIAPVNFPSSVQNEEDTCFFFWFINPLLEGLNC